ncbi:hypothetical protein B0T16DRAFT_330535 [Cercophora newfieldiana]|uniref:C2H2-type domain-containing protein n=1 Tax=Cercophora newfieldiana TaxID=92897 RepID=A0AA39Y5D9_9PEZI|nr:hypothetical protein B0T16DRAFT_330535 [Cercophora newfieldiana]
MLGSPFPDLSGPSVISPISLSDASESLGVSPEAQRKHEQGEDGVASDHDGRRKKAKRTAGKGVEGPAGKKFACPYFKRNRVKYSKWTSCPGPGWDEVHRVKTHLYRRHALPIQCPRCWGVFKSDELLRSHLQQNPPCVSSDNRTLVEGFTKDQEKRLRSRKKAQADTTDDDKWREIYTILFPDDDEQSIPSPYYEPADYDEPSPPRRTSGSGPSSDLEDYTTFVKREMPTLVRREIEVMLQHDNFEDPQLEARFRSRIADVVLQLQPRLIDLYKQSQTPLSEWGPASGTVNPGSDSSMFTPALSQHTGTDAGSTPATVDGQQPSVPVASDGLGLYDGGGFTFDPNVGSGAGAWDGQAGGDPVVDVSAFDWDEEFESMLNPSLFMPQGLQYQYVPQPEPVLPSGVPRAWGNTK